MAWLPRLIFHHYWETVSVVGAVGAWTVWCWFAGIGAHPAAHVLALACLFAVFRLSAGLYEREDHVAPIRHRLGGIVLAAGVASGGGAAALAVAAVGWLALAQLIGFTAEAGTPLGVPAAWFGPHFGFVGSLSALGGIGLVLHGYLHGYRALEVTRLDVALPHLGPALDGFRIVHLSDLHVGPIADRAVLRAGLARALEEDPDLIVVTGDVVDSPATELAAWTDELAVLHARHGVIAILGNHDRYARSDRVAAWLRSLGWIVLRDAVHRVVVDGDPLAIAGLEYRKPPRQTKRLPGLATSLPPDVPTITLVHHPNAFPAAAALGLPLVLAGHTHGGQIAVPFLRRWNAARVLMTPFDAGTFVHGSSLLHVNRGLGVSGQRLRIATTREITVVTLRRRVR